MDCHRLLEELVCRNMEVSDDNSNAVNDKAMC